MSMTAEMRAQLERERLEQVRLEGVRREAEALLARCEERLRAETDPVAQQMAAEALRRVASRMREARAALQERPDDALAQVKEVHREACQTLARAHDQAEAWVEARARATALRDAVAAAREAGGGAGEAAFAKAERAVRRVEAMAAGVGPEGLDEAVAEADAALAEARQAGLDERVRREVVKGLVRTLGDLGFVVGGPRLVEGEAHGGVVTLMGRLPSGRQARFEVRLDGALTFDLDGYEGRACAQDLERVQRVMQERCGVRLGPPQVVWKAPERLTKGARDLPSGQRGRGRG